MIFILCCIIVTSTSLFGLLSLCAVTSPRHWFLRTASVLGVLLMFLLIPAYELFVCFGTQALVLCIAIAARRGVILWRVRRSTANGDVNNRLLPKVSGSHSHFSLQTLLLITVVIAILVWVSTGLPNFELVAWAIVVGMGIQAAIQTIMAAWIVYGGISKWLRIPLAILIPIASHVTLLWAFSALASFSRSILFPPQPFGDRVGDLLDVEPFLADLGRDNDWASRLASVGVCLAVVALTTGLLALFRTAGMIPHSLPQNRSHRRRVARICAIGLTSFMAALPVWIYWRIVHPTPIPEVSLPVPNGYDTFLEAGRLLDSSILDDPENASTNALRAEVLKYQRVYDLIRSGLASDCVKPLRYDIEDSSTATSELPLMRSLGRALCGAGHLAKADKNHREALRNYLDAVRLGSAVRNGGLMIDALIGNAIESTGLLHVSNVQPELDAECREALRELLAVDQVAEPIHEIIGRDRIWVEHACGWQGRLEIAMSDLWPDDENQKQSFALSMQRLQTVRRLLMVELALRAFQLKNDRFPDALTELVPGYLPSVPCDSFSNSPLVYRRDGDKYLLYSIGHDGIDDGGKRVSLVGQFTGRSDLFFESYFNND
jgi:hypothetical protein